jgi:arginine utilization protein RocB
MEAVSRAVNSLHDQIAWPVAVRNFFPYISDMSLLAMSEDEDSIACLARNMPAWGGKYTFDPRPVLDLDVPVINVGTYGKDAHKMTERVHMPYTFQVLPELTLRIVEQLVGFEEALSG